MSLAAKTKALLTGGANKRRRSLNTRRPPNNGSNRPDNPQDRSVPRPDPFPPRLGQLGQRLRIQTEPDKNALHHQQPAAFLHSRASESAFNTRRRRKPSESPPQLQFRQNSYLQAGKRGDSSGVFHEMLRVTPTSRELWMLSRRVRRLRCARAPRART